MFKTSVTLNIKATGTVTKSDYDQLQPLIQKRVEAQGDIRLLLDMTEFQGEELDAMRKDLTLGQDFSGKVEKMAIVGDRKWEKWTAKLMDSFSAIHRSRPLISATVNSRKLNCWQRDLMVKGTLCSSVVASTKTSKDDLALLTLQARLLRESGSKRELAETLETLTALDVPDHPRQQAQFLCELARIQEEDLGDDSTAQSSWERAFDLDPNRDEAALTELEETYTSAAAALKALCNE